jgi:hypothetical protein
MPSIQDATIIVLKVCAWIDLLGGALFGSYVFFTNIFHSGAALAGLPGIGAVGGLARLAQGVLVWAQLYVIATCAEALLDLAYGD